MLIATTLYILVALVATGALPFDQLKGQDAPLAEALSEGAGMEWAAEIISFGALVAITSVVLTLLYGQSRILFAMSRDGLMPRRISRVNPRTRTPVMIIGICGLAFAALAAAVPLKEIVELVNIGTLFAFVVVNLGVIILRRTRPDLPRGYRVPLGARGSRSSARSFCVYLMYKTARHHLGAVLHLDGARRRDLLPLRKSATRACARARSSTPRRSSPPPNGGDPGPPQRPRDPQSLSGRDDERVAHGRIGRYPHLEAAVGRPQRVVRHRRAVEPTLSTVDPRGSVWPTGTSVTGASLVSVTVVWRLPVPRREHVGRAVAQADVLAL